MQSFHPEIGFMQQWKFDWCHYSYFSAKLYFIELIFNIFLKSSLNFGSYCDEDLQASKNLSLMRKSMALEFNYFKKIEWYSYGSGTSYCRFSHLIGFFVVVAIDIQHVFPLMNVLNLVGSIDKLASWSFLSNFYYHIYFYFISPML